MVCVCVRAVHVFGIECCIVLCYNGDNFTPNIWQIDERTDSEQASKHRRQNVDTVNVHGEYDWIGSNKVHTWMECVHVCANVLKEMSEWTFVIVKNGTQSTTTPKENKNQTKSKKEKHGMNRAH